MHKQPKSLFLNSVAQRLLYAMILLIPLTALLYWALQ